MLSCTGELSYYSVPRKNNILLVLCARLVVLIYIKWNFLSSRSNLRSEVTKINLIPTKTQCQETTRINRQNRSLGPWKNTSETVMFPNS